ncbi:hypothetical protein O181_055269 [Austropuccinia psidii MF-1]|uniref:Alpha-galactosidase n=1 Tax=Austropuccinia psidii MF-1 TaxID=1389203 RepID=A0A9Q3E681_9BASI|nr:hypothetical protein [Austropuccinia psidii MF-1]
MRFLPAVVMRAKATELGILTHRMSLNGSHPRRPKVPWIALHHPRRLRHWALVGRWAADDATVSPSSASPSLGCVTLSCRCLQCLRRSSEEISRRSPQQPQVGTKPLLGWNSYYPLKCGKNLNEKNLKNQVDLLVEKGLQKSGYKTIILQCGWEAQMQPDGTPQVNHKAFPSGMPSFSKYLTTKGLYLGLATEGGEELCRRKKRYRKRNLGSDLTLSTLEKRQPKSQQITLKTQNVLSKYVPTLIKSWGMSYIFYRPLA